MQSTFFTACTGFDSNRLIEMPFYLEIVHFVWACLRHVDVKGICFFNFLSVYKQRGALVPLYLTPRSAGLVGLEVEKWRELVSRTMLTHNPLVPTPPGKREMQRVESENYLFVLPWVLVYMLNLQRNPFTLFKKVFCGILFYRSWGSWVELLLGHWVHWSLTTGQVSDSLLQSPSLSHSGYALQSGFFTTVWDTCVCVCKSLQLEGLPLKRSVLHVLCLCAEFYREVLPRWPRGWTVSDCVWWSRSDSWTHQHQASSAPGWGAGLRKRERDTCTLTNAPPLD